MVVGVVVGGGVTIVFVGAEVVFGDKGISLTTYSISRGP